MIGDPGIGTGQGHLPRVREGNGLLTVRGEYSRNNDKRLLLSMESDNREIHNHKTDDES